MLIEKADSSLDMGTVALSGGSAAFSNVLDLGKTNADGMAVCVRATVSAAGGTSIVLKLQGAASTTGTWSDIISTPSITVASITSGDVAELPVPRDNGYPCLRVYATVTGTFTAGTLAAQLDTYTRG
jgi:hypothetical protein